MIYKALVTVLLGFFALYSCDFSGDDDKTEDDTVTKDLKLAVFGDSIAVGVFSDSQLGGTASVDHPLVKALFPQSNTTDKAENSQQMDEYYRKNVENSFTCPVSNCKFSLAHQLKISANESNSFARVGSRYSTPPADKKAVTISQQIAKFKGQAEIYVLEAGANDFCAEDYDENKVKEAIEKAIDEVYTQNAEAKVIVVPVPNIFLVFEVAEDGEPAISEITGGKGAPDISKPTCRDMRKNSCPRLSNPDKKAKPEELKALNGAIATIVNTVKDSNKKIAVATDVASHRFAKEHIAADCFHPSAKGLEVIAGHTKKAYDSL